MTFLLKRFTRRTPTPDWMRMKFEFWCYFKYWKITTISIRYTKDEKKGNVERMKPWKSNNDCIVVQRKWFHSIEDRFTRWYLVNSYQGTRQNRPSEDVLPQIVCSRRMFLRQLFAAQENVYYRPLEQFVPFLRNKTNLRSDSRSIIYWISWFTLKNEKKYSITKKRFFCMKMK